MIDPRRLQRVIRTSAPLRRALLTAILGSLLLLVGVSLSFRLLLMPFVSVVEDGISGVLSQFVGEDALPMARHTVSGLFLVSGAYFAYSAFRNVLREITRILNPGHEGRIVGQVLRHQALAAGPDVVAIGGGTGLSTLLRGLKLQTNRLTAVVTVTDDGGSSGRLVNDKKILPPGDLRNCLVALADAEKSMTDLFQHRFEGASGSLSGHSTGNLLIAAMVDIAGDFDKAIREVSRVLAIQGRVIPATLDTVRLRGEMDDGSTIIGESRIVNSRLGIKRISLDPADCKPVTDALLALREADVIAIGPGSIYTSVIPPLLVPGFADAIAESPAIKVYICNVMTQPGESDDFTASDHVKAIEQNVGRRIFDYVLLNKAQPSDKSLERYEGVGQTVVIADTERIRAMGYKPVAANLISESDVVRHDPNRVAESIMRLFE
ncbi:MAG: YvcK family protein [Armatimonadota bacterium]|nr:YvcK family protein [Armatimonadota bacterium]